MEPRFGQSFSHVRVHADATAAASAAAIGAAAYTIGDDIVLGGSLPPPQTKAHTQLLAHELTHVVQQGPSAAAAEPKIEASVNQRAEREAAITAESVSAGRAAPPLSARGSGPVVQCSLLGGIAGAGLGMLGGAALGFLAGGPVGAIIGGVLGGVAGLAVGDAVSAPERPLSAPERTEAELVFGRSLNMDAVRLTEAPLMGIGNIARTPFGTIYFPPGSFRLPTADFIPWLIHELAHVWQHQHGLSVFEKLFWALHGASAYEYGGETALREATRTGKRFTNFNTEQQADICRDYYVRLKAGQDVSAWLPFIQQVRGARATR